MRHRVGPCLVTWAGSLVHEDDATPRLVRRLMLGHLRHVLAHWRGLVLGRAVPCSPSCTFVVNVWRIEVQAGALGEKGRSS